MKNQLYSQIVGSSGFKTVDTWNEADHPRADNGQFGSGGGGAKKSAPKAKAASASKTGSATEKAIANAVKGGANPKEVKAKLDKLLNHFDPKNWAAALAYEGFASNATAEKLAEALRAEREGGEKTAEKPAEKSAKKVDMKKWMAKYEEREDNNYHAENALEVAKLVGTPEDIAEIKAINRRHMASNSGISQEDYKKRHEIFSRLWPKVKALMGE